MLKYAKRDEITQELFKLFAEVFGLNEDQKEKLTLKTRIIEIFRLSEKSHALVQIGFSVEERFKIQLADNQIEQLTNSIATLGNWFGVVFNKILEK